MRKSRPYTPIVTPGPDHPHDACDPARLAWTRRRTVPVLVFFALSAFGMVAQERQGRTRNPHGSLTIACNNCHTSTNWRPIRPAPDFDHSETRYPLRGMHRGVYCRTCHLQLVFSNAGTQCADCHADIHRRQMGSNCEQCHTVRGWRESTKAVRDHQNRFPLMGAHAAIDCELCHRGAAVGRFEGLSTGCVSCHLRDYQNGRPLDHQAAKLSTACESCHSSMDTWLAARLDHAASTSFVLTGAHVSLGCTTCHVGGRFAGTPSDCYGCHNKNYSNTNKPNHAGAGFVKECTVCHNTTSWSGAQFNHTSNTVFSLTGAHAGAGCNSCHGGGRFAGTSTACYSCHTADYGGTKNPDHAKGKFPTDCASCHSVENWAGARFDHSITSFPLTGAHASKDCTACHVNGNYKLTSAGCVSCHRADFDKTTNPNHGAAGFPQDCSVCHATAAWAGATFDHNKTKFPLTGGHAAEQCSSCHAGGQFATLSTNCQSCHLTDFNKTTNPNHPAAGFPQDCSVCHTTAAWAGAAFDHNKTRFPLSGAHAAEQCSSCHAGGQYATLSTNCQSCHITDFNKTTNPNHPAAGFPQDCSVCHTTAAWAGAAFDHNKTRFPLSGAHASEQCSACHAGGKYATLSTNCQSCHLTDFNKTTNPNHPAAGFPQDCSVCHTTASWAGATFDHNKTRFPLSGAHAAEQCSACHAGGQYSTLSTNCQSCHLTDFNKTTNPNHPAAGFPQDCSVCHTTASWAGATFDHAKTRFPLVGSHVAADCSACHSSGQYTTLSTTCQSCHLSAFNKTTNPNHTAAGFPQDCSLCHTPTSWQGATFNHSSTGFLLSGAHVSLACIQCHPNNVFAGTAKTCSSCHIAAYSKTSNPNHAAAGFPQDCSLCHSTASWAGATFNHSNTRFPLLGAHVGLQCSSCHAGGQYATLPATCQSCHIKDYNGTTNPNHAAAGFPQDCSICHSSVSWAGATFDHSKTPFPLTGAHLKVACVSCHLNNVFAGTPTSCYSCHSSEYKSVTNPNHAAAGFPTTCQTCHTTTAWTGATFNHTWFPTNHGRAAGVCATCHTNSSNYSVFVCTSCHVKTQTDSHHQSVKGYVYNSTNCYQCHPRGSGG